MWGSAIAAAKRWKVGTPCKPRRPAARRPVNWARDVHAALAIMNKQLGLSHGKCVKLLGTLFEGLSIARGTSARSLARTAKRCEPAYEQLRQDIRSSPQIVPDETGWRVGGRTAWLHAFVGRRETVYVIDPTRSGTPAEELLGADWSGTLVHDGWSVYDRFTQGRSSTMPGALAAPLRATAGDGRAWGRRACRGPCWG